MSIDNKIYAVLKLPFANRKDNLGDKICQDVDDIVQELKSKNMNQEELSALRSCYEAAYQDSMGSLQIIVTLAALFAGTNVIGDFPLFAEIQFLVKLILLVGWLLYSYYKIHKLSKESASLRNHIMAVFILLTENK